jgi:hypothetical protein
MDNRWNITSLWTKSKKTLFICRSKERVACEGLLFGDLSCFIMISSSFRGQRCFAFQRFEILKFRNQMASMSLANEPVPLQSYFNWNGERAPAGFWGVIANQRKCLLWIAPQLGIKTMDDWYKVKNADIRALGVGRILDFFGDSLAALLFSAYPEYEWKPWKFLHVSRSYWEDMDNQRVCFDTLARDLKLNDLSDWYKVSSADLKDASILLNRHNNSLVQALQNIYPEYPWQLWKFERKPKEFWDDIQKQVQFFCEARD